MMECRGVRLIPSGPQFRCFNWFPVILTTLTKTLILVLCILSSNNFYLRLTGENYVNLNSRDQPWPPVTDIHADQCQQLTLVEDEMRSQTVRYFDSCSPDSELPDKSVDWSVGEDIVFPDPGHKISSRKWCSDVPEHQPHYAIVYAEKREDKGVVKTYFKMASNDEEEAEPINEGLYSDSIRVYCGYINFTFGPIIAVLFWIVAFVLIPLLITLLHNRPNFEVFSGNPDFLFLGVISYFHVGPSTYNDGSAR